MGNPTLQDLPEKDTWVTPDWLTDGIAEAIGGFDLDPCAGPQTNIADTNWSIQRGEDGLKREWFGDVWVNPPFSDKETWLRECVSSVGTDSNGSLDETAEAVDQTASPDEGADRVFVLTPDSTDVKSWFHSYCTMADYVWFSKGRVKFIDPETGESADQPSFGTAISVFGDIEPPLREWFHAKGWLTETASWTVKGKRQYDITD